MILVLVIGGRDYITPRRQYIPGIEVVYTSNWLIIYFLPPFTRTWSICWCRFGGAHGNWHSGPNSTCQVICQWCWCHKCQAWQNVGGPKVVVKQHIGGFVASRNQWNLPPLKTETNVPWKSCWLVQMYSLLKVRFRECITCCHVSFFLPCFFGCHGVMEAFCQHFCERSAFSWLFCWCLL